MFDDILPNAKPQSMDMTDISKTWGKTSWMFAYALAYSSIGMAPTTAGRVRALSMGEIVVHAFDITSMKTEL